MEYLENMWTNFMNWLTGEPMGWTKIVGAVLTALLGWLFLVIVVAIIRKSVNRSRMNGLAGNLLITVLKILLTFCYLLIILKILGIDTSGLIAVLAACSLALSLALETTLSNFASGMILVSNKIFEAGDYVCAGGMEGTVIEITLFATKLITPDNKEISIPNSVVAGGQITNYSREKKRRVDIDVSVAYGTSIEKVKTAVAEVFDNNELVIHEDDYTIRVKDYVDSAMQFTCRCYCKNEDYWEVFFALHEAIINKFEDERIEIPYSQIDVNINNQENN